MAPPVNLSNHREDNHYATAVLFRVLSHPRSSEALFLIYIRAAVAAFQIILLQNRVLARASLDHEDMQSYLFTNRYLYDILILYRRLSMYVYKCYDWVKFLIYRFDSNCDSSVDVSLRHRINSYHLENSNVLYTSTYFSIYKYLQLDKEQKYKRRQSRKL